MTDRILGLDIGRDAVKGVQVITDLRGKCRITAVADYDIAAEGGIAAALDKIQADERFKYDVCIASLPADRFSFRNITVPFRETRKIRQTINFELEPLIPYAIEEVVTDFTVIGQSKGPETNPGEQPSGSPVEGSEILAAAVPKDEIAERLRMIEPMQVSLLEIEAVPVALQLIAAGYDQGCFVLLDIGVQKTVAVFFREGKIFQIRPFAFGGENITEAAARSGQMDREEAEREKRMGAFTATSPQVAEADKRFFAELKHTLQFLKLRRTDERPARIFITGGGALCGFLPRSWPGTAPSPRRGSI